MSIEKSEDTKGVIPAKTGVNTGAPEGYSFPAQLDKGKFQYLLY